MTSLNSGRIRNGIADWIFEEEILSGSNELFFSPDSTKLGFLRFDDSNVKQFNFTYWGLSPSTGAYPSTTHLRYPKPGYAGPTVALLVFDRNTRSTITLEIDAPQFAHNYYVYQVLWFGDSTVLVRLMNREQTVEDIVACDVTTGTCRLATSNVAPMGWVEHSALVPVLERNAFLQVRLLHSSLTH